jgi:cystathionine beta-lyase
MQEAGRQSNEHVEYYGRKGTSTTFAFQTAMCALEEAAGCFVYPSGTSALTTALLAFLNTGDHLLMVDSVYEPTRDFCRGTLLEKGIEVSYYDPIDADSLTQLIKPNTRVIFLESPGSLTMEVQDVPKIVAMAKAHNIVTIIDNTFATAYNFAPIPAGIDISVQSATKYICGHSDIMLGVTCANQKTWPRLQEISFQLGLCASVDDVYTALRGLRTMGLRLRQHDQSALQVAQWLSAREEVDYVLHPAFDSCPGSEYFKRDFSGGNGLFSFVLKGGNERSIAAMLDGYHHFKLGFSWGGYESLVLHAHGFQGRQYTRLCSGQNLIRLHIGLESVKDLLDDLQLGFERFREAS